MIFAILWLARRRRYEYNINKKFGFEIDFSMCPHIYADRTWNKRGICF